MSAYPEHEKLRAIKEESQVCGEFIEWLGMQGYSVEPISRKTRAFVLRAQLANFFEIDEEKLEEEKQAMLEELRRGAR